MPNWCENNISFEIKNNKKVNDFLDKVEEFFNEEKFNDFFIPANGLYDRVELWGTKWDINAINFCRNNIDLDYLRVNISFDTAWSPNIPVSKIFYNRLQEFDEVKDYSHEYVESGCGFYGKFNGNCDDCRDINIMYYILNDEQPSLSLENFENNMLKFEDCDSLFIVKSSSEEKMGYYNDEYIVKVYKCFSETFGENIVIYEYDDNFYSFDIY